MKTYILKRFAFMLLSLFLLSIIAYVAIQLPPGDLVKMKIRQLEMSGRLVDKEEVAAIKLQYGEDLPYVQRYFHWIGNIILHGNFGESYLYEKRPVLELILERLPYTVLLALLGQFIAYLFAIPMALISAIRQYKFIDNAITVLCFIGMGTPAFLITLIVMYFLLQVFGIPAGGLFSQEFLAAPWSIAKLLDLGKHLIVPSIVLGLTGSGGLIRTLRATILDELGKDYVETARLKGLSEFKVLMKYPFRIAINPVISCLGMVLSQLVGGDVFISSVASLSTIGPLLVEGCINQDMYLAGGIFLMQAALTMIGIFLSDMLLAKTDPRIRFD